MWPVAKESARSKESFTEVPCLHLSRQKLAPHVDTVSCKGLQVRFGLAHKREMGEDPK